MSLEPDTCVITGATGGIGTELCRQLADAGTSLMVTGRDQNRLDALCDVLPASANVQAVVADLSQDSDRQKLAKQASAAHCNTLINLSGLNTLSLLEDLPLDELERMIQLNVIAPMRLTQLLLGSLKRQPRAQIVNVGSAFGSIGHPGYTAYCASKFALRGFSESLRRELADTNVEVLYVAPRATATAMNSKAATQLNAALGNHMDAPTWVADQIVKTMHQHNKSKVLGWPEKFFAWLNQNVPALVDQAMAKNLSTIKQFAQPTAQMVETQPRPESVNP
jgi:short-subunit dehydrogenase